MLVFEKLEYYEGEEKYDNVEIKIFDYFEYIEARYKTNNMLIKIKKDNTEIELK